MGTFNDRPIEGDDLQKFDKLGLSDYAEALATFIKTCNSPMTIGIQGDWGLGKTSLMNMIDSFLDNKYYKKVWFNTWHYSLFDQDELLGISVIQALVNEMANIFNLHQNEFHHKATRFLKNVARQLTIKGVQLGKAIDDAKETHDNENIATQMLNFKNEFIKLVNELLKTDQNNRKQQVVFFIDDIDRIKPGKALELLESLKNFLDVQGCIFVLAVDYEVIQMGMTEKFGSDLQKASGKSFFDKIIQLPFVMPTTNYQLGEYIAHLLSESGYLGTKDGKAARLNDIQKKFYEDITSVTVGRNPRSIKRVINYVRLLDIIRSNHARTSEIKVHKNTQRQILYALICMQTAWPEVFLYFSKFPTPETIKNLGNIEFIRTIPKAKKLFDRLSDEEKLKKNIPAYFDILFALLDENQDGNIDKKELEPILLMLQLAKFTSIEATEEPVDRFYKIVIENEKKWLTKKKNIEADEKGLFHSRFFREIYCKSKFRKNPECKLQIASKERFMTITRNRTRIGSLVSLVRSPLLFRLEVDPQEFKSMLKKNVKWHYEEHRKLVNSNDFIKDLSGNSVTGFGDTQINIELLMSLPNKLAINLMDILHKVLIKIQK
jgi:hypothetical protein